jgi:glyoxylate/hydroxypyruvate reductase
MSQLKVLIASPLEARHVARMRQVDPRVHVLYRPDLLGKPRYMADHYALPTRSAAEEEQWLELLAQAEVLYDFDRTHLHDLLARAPRLRWVQSTSSGVGALLFEHGFDRSELIVTNAAGIHAVPLTEFCLMAMLMHVKRLGHMQQLQAERSWERFHSTTLRGKTLGIIGLGAIGSELGRSARALGMRVHGVKSALRPDLHAEALHVDRLWPIDRLAELLPELDFVVACLPHTPATLGRFGAREFALLRETCYFINIGRGPTVDEPALIEALREGRIAGAALDVVAHEPLAADSPLWTLPNVIICPHSAATVESEDEALVELFCENLRRYLDGRPLHNLVDKQRGY